MSIETMKQALEALENKFLFIAGDGEAIDLRANAITALRAAIEQAEKQEPAAWMTVKETWGLPKMVVSETKKDGWTPVYTTPPQRDDTPAKAVEWQGLTDEEIRKTDHHMVDGAYHYSFKQGAKWAEAKLKEKNT